MSPVCFAPQKFKLILILLVLLGTAGIDVGISSPAEPSSHPWVLSACRFVSRDAGDADGTTWPAPPPPQDDAAHFVVNFPKMHGGGCFMDPGCVAARFSTSGVTALDVSPPGSSTNATERVTIGGACPQRPADGAFTDALPLVPPEGLNKKRVVILLRMYVVG